MMLQQDMRRRISNESFRGRGWTMKKLGVLLSTILFVCIGFSGCGGGSSKSNSNSNGTATLTSITVTGKNAVTSVSAGGTLQLVAQGKYSDGTSKDISSSV